MDLYYPKAYFTRGVLRGLKTPEIPVLSSGLGAQKDKLFNPLFASCFDTSRVLYFGFRH